MLSARLRLLPALALLLAACEVTPSGDVATTDSTAVEPPFVHAASDVEAGRYLVIAGGCNDCHTPGYLERGMAVPESVWLTGSPIGFRGPWGTTYPHNLRLSVQRMDEDLWVQTLRTRHALPPMPWVNVNHMSERDTRAMHRYIHSLGPAGPATPPAIPPGQEPATPYYDFVPQHLERMPSGPPPASPATPMSPGPTAPSAPATPTPPPDSTQR